MRDSALKGKLTAKTESKTLIKANLSREEFVAVNNGANNVWLAFGPTAVAEEGVMLAKEGGSIAEDHYRGEVTAITKTGESVISYTEL